jgi:hypothetical protein
MQIQLIESEKKIVFDERVRELSLVSKYTVVSLYTTML